MESVDGRWMEQEEAEKAENERSATGMHAARVFGRVATGAAAAGGHGRRCWSTRTEMLHPKDGILRRGDICELAGWRVLLVAW